MLTLISLFFGAFLAATILPFSSEVMLTLALTSGEFDTWLLVSIAAVGNTLGALLNWYLGRFLMHWSNHRWFPFSQPQLIRAEHAFNRYGLWSLLFAWVPVVGDPLTFAAGALNVRLAVFLPLVAVGKSLRYVAIGWII